MARKGSGQNANRVRTLVAATSWPGSPWREPPPRYRRRTRAIAATAPVADTGDAPARRPSALRPDARVAAAETGTPKELAKSHGPDGSDFMVDVIKTLNIDYVVLQPGLELPRPS